MKKLMSLLLALAMVVSLCACGGKTDETQASTTAAAATTTEAAEAEDEETTAAEQASESEAAEALVGVNADADYDEISEEIYNEVLGEFYELYLTAADCTDVNERYALMAVAEAKLLESGVMLPTTSQGGSYVMCRFAPNTVTSVKWGGDAERFETLLVTEEEIKAEDWTAMRAIYAECVGTGTYYEAAKQYLADNGYTLKTTYNIAYSADPETWDLFAEWNSTLYEPLAVTFDNLMQYDCENTLQPALAESYEKVENDDGTVTYNFKLREGVMWVDSQGREVAEVVADDFVAGAQHLFDAGSGIEDLLTSDGAFVVGATEYYTGEISDFSEIGIEATDKYVISYTLEKDVPYFLTMLGYTTFSPLCRSYYKSQGGTFTAEGDEYTSGDYGTDPDHIVYCGPYLITGWTADNSINYKLNESYWNKDQVSLTEVNWLYDDGSDNQKSYDDFWNGVTDSVGLNSERIVIAKKQGTFDEYTHISGTNATAYLIYLNLNRASFTNYNDVNALASEKTQEQVNTAYEAVNNLHFRNAMTHAVDRVTYNEQRKGADLKSNNLINSYTTGDFVSLTEDVTIDINGTATTFKAGTYYGEILQAQLDADEYPVLAWNPEANDGLGGSTGYDGWYDLEYAKAEFEAAVEELASEGIEVTAENPIVLDYPVWDGSETYINSANVYKQCIEEAFDGLVQINICTTSDVYEWYYAEYYCYTGADMNFDVGDMTGWSPDYGDPCSMLATFLPYYSGYCTMSLGIY